MSVRLLGKAFYADLPSHLKLLLLALCDEASEDGTGISIGQVRLATKCGTTERSVRTNLGELRRLGWIVEAGRDPKYRTNRHEVVVGRLGITPEESSGRAVLTPEVERWPDRKLSVAGTGSPLPPTQELPVTTTQEQELPPRKRDDLADALARAEGADPLEVPASRMRTLCVKANELRKLNPNITPEEILRRAGNWTTHYEGASISGPAIVAHWGTLANGNTTTSGSLVDRVKARMDATR